jgi:hypothetical protein
MSDKHKQTVGEFINNFDHFTRGCGTGTVIIHPNLPYNLIELKEEFVNQLKNDLSTKLTLAQNGIDRLSPTERFAIMLLEDAY